MDPDEPGIHTPSTDSGETMALLEELKQNIWQRRPILGQIIEKHGNDTLFEYAHDFLDVNPIPRLDARKPELIEVVREMVSARLSKEVGDAVARQLSALPLVSTTDHHAPIQHPFFLNSNIITALPYRSSGNPLLRYLINFSFASVSLNNVSGFARGLLFHGDANGDAETIRFPLFLDRDKMSCVYAMRPLGKEEIQKAADLLLKRESGGDITPGRGAKVKALLETYFGSEDILSAKDLSTQITKINFHLWPTFFEEKREDNLVPELIYLDIESLVTELLFRHHLHNPSSLIHRTIFDSSLQTLVRMAFNNIPGAFSEENDWGTYFFWGLDAKGHRVRLFLREGRLMSEDGKDHIAFTPKGVQGALERKEIFPSMLLCYLIVSLYYGMKCLGGFCQVNDLTMTKYAWQKFLRQMGETEEAEAVETTQTKELGGDGLVLSYLENSLGDVVPATGIDLSLENPKVSFATYETLSKQVTLSEMMNPMIPEMYTVLYSMKDRDERLTAVKPEEIIRATNLKQKVFYHHE